MTTSSTASPNVTFRWARPDEVAEISALVLRSKAHWGYDDAFVEACRDDLTIDPSWCDGIRLEVAERDGRLLGYSRISGTPPQGTLDGLFVEPSAIGSGVGRALLRRAVGTAARLGMTSLAIESDPHAEPFYLHAGAVRIGEAVSSVFAGRRLPLLTLAVQNPPAA